MILRKNYLLPYLFLTVFFLFNGINAQAASTIYSKQLSSENAAIPAKDILRADVFVTLSVKEFSGVSGQKLSLVQKLFFKAVQKRLKKDLKINPDLMVTEYFDPVKKKFKFDPLWFILGVMIGPLAILFAWTSKQKKDSKKSVILAFPLFLLWFGYVFLF